jgi:hypothetical protein
VPLHAEEAAPRETIDFKRDVEPIFSGACYRCHGPEAQESGYRLDLRQAAFHAGDLSAPNIVPGNSAESPLIQYVSLGGDLEMPADGPRLSKTELETLRTWVDQGAIWPGDDEVSGDPAGEAIRTDHWSFQPIAHPQPPVVNGEWPTNGVDNFILARLQSAGLSPSPPADRRKLIRRLYLDMHGLPPTPEEVSAFIAENRPDAYTQLVESVLSSPRYGERWGQHWLDVVRFAESDGFETNNERPNAWPYRDYIIGAFNSDKPYNAFIAEQLAGDALGEPAATGFLVAGPWDRVKSPDVVLTLMQRQDELADIVNTTATAFLGLTVGCARCHNHKFDPILQTDFYALQAVFAGVQHGERPFATASVANADDGLREAVNPQENEDRFPEIVSQAMRFSIRATNNGIEPCLDELEVWSASHGGEASRNVASAENGGRPTSSGDYPNSAIHRLPHINDGKYGNDWSWISDSPGTGWVRIDFSSPAAINRVTWGRDRTGGFSDRLAVDYSIEVMDVNGRWIEVANSTARRPHLSNQPMVYAGQFHQPDQPTRRLFRGDPASPKEIIAPNAPAIFGTPALAADAPEQQRRLALARWIASDDNPLTARVMANRIWQNHFGVGLVDTPSDFGGNGTKPSHPELLDWLARRFIESGWSIKHVHRVILLSSAYRQSSLPLEAGLAVDAGSRLLWRFPPRRLEAEAIHDSVLYVTGNLDLAMGGPGWRAFEPNDNYVRVYEPKEVFGPAEWRRMAYMQRIRMRPDGVFGAFDAPDGGQACPKRGRSITAIQALNLFNSQFMLDQSQRFAERLSRDAGPQPPDQIRRAFELAYNRLPEGEESHASQKLIAAHGLPAFCRALLNSNELIFVP